MQASQANRHTDQKDNQAIGQTKQTVEIHDRK